MLRHIFEALRVVRPTGACALLLGASLTLAGCGGESAAGGEEGTAVGADSASEGHVASAAAEAAPIEDGGPVTDFPPNELGQILVLEYHRLGQQEGEWVRKPENFRKDLQMLYDRGYRPVTMRQVIEGDINIPAGTTPVVFTMDDSSVGQFYLREDGSVDPNTMVGMWDAFQKKNPGWKNGAVWCVLPAAGHPSNFFSEKPDKEIPRAQREANIRKKVDHLVQNGHEMCNHTLYHARLDQANDARVQEYLGRGEDSIQVYLPEGYDIVTMALPLGMWPKNRTLAWKGNWPGREGENRPVAYEYAVVLEVSGDENESPFDAKFDPHSVDRFIVAPGRLERKLEAWERNPQNRFISDGIPNVISVPQGEAGRVDRNRWKDREVREVQQTAAAAPPAGS